LLRQAKADDGIPSPSGMQVIGDSDRLSMRQCCDAVLLTHYFRPWGDIVVSSYVRFAAGVCVLSTGLFLGATGGAVATADTDASDSSATGDSAGLSQGTDTPSSPVDSPMTSPIDSMRDSLQKTVQGVMSTFGSGRTPGLWPSTRADSSRVEPGGSTETADENDDSGVAVAPPVEAVQTVVEPVTDVVEPVASVVESAPAAGAPAPAAGASAPSVAAVPNVVAPVATVVTGLAATTADVITLVEEMLTSAAAAAQVFTSLQPDLAALFGIAGVEAHGDVGQSARAGASFPVIPTKLQSPVGAPQTGIPGVTWVDKAPGAAPLGWSATTLLGQESPLAEASGSDGLIPVGVREFFQEAFDEIRQSPALAALLLAALPGLGGLLVLTGAGTRLGYRQAKAGIALRTAGIARFARSGPLGVVRSGSLVYVRPRASRVVRPGTLGAGRFLDEAA
jgi:hypothetical protein